MAGGLGYGKLASGSYFVGLMVATAVRGFVPAVTLVTAPLLCKNGNGEVHASWYRCVDGVADGVPSVMPMASNDMPDIIVVIALSTFLYGTVCFALAVVARLALGSSSPKG